MPAHMNLVALEVHTSQKRLRKPDPALAKYGLEAFFLHTRSPLSSWFKERCAILLDLGRTLGPKGPAAAKDEQVWSCGRLDLLLGRSARPRPG
eukprot:4972235-Amphidinium_carterae.1